MKTLMHDGNLLHYRDDGPPAGRPVLLLNSLGADLRVWDPLLPHLTADLRIIRHDKRGHGLSDAPQGPYTIAELSADAAALLDHLGLRDVVVVGLSIGGLIAQHLATTRPDLVAALVIMDSAAKIGTPEMWQDRIKTVTTDGLEAMAPAILTRWFAPEFHRTRPAELALWRNMLCRTTVAGYAGCCAAIAVADLTATTRALTCPALVMVGSADGATPPDLVQATAALMGAPCHVIDGAGHLPCVEAPEQVARLINGFLDSLS